jgi:signal transduction histidine kinase
VRGDPQLLSFVTRELIRNAVEALPGSAGEVLVALKHVASRGVIQVMVRDSGRGIAPHLQNRLFQPFFTTKDGHQGLSLSRARRYAEFHGGTLTLIESAPGGTLFQLELPVADRPSTAGFAAMTQRRPQPGAS